MRIINSLFLAAISLGVTGVGMAPLHAEDAPVAAPPSAFEAVAAKLPKPSADNAFAFSGEFVHSGQVVGTVELKAFQSPQDMWTFTLEIKSPQQGSMFESATCLPNLMPTIGERVLTDPTGKQNKTTWAAHKDGGVVLGDEAGTHIPHKGAYLTSVTSLLHFCRLIEFLPGTWEAGIYSANDQKIVGAKWTTGTTGPWGAEQAARLVKGARTDGKTIEAGFDPVTGDLLGAKFTDASDGSVAEFRRAATKPAPNDLFTRDAKDAKEAAAQAAFGFSMADFDLLERVIHWPSVHEQLKGLDPKYAAMDVAAAKADVMSQYREALEPRGARDVIAARVEGGIPGATTTGDDNETVVEFGPSFNDLKLTAGKRDGKWYLIRIPL